MTTTVCFTDRILALEIPSKECALGLMEQAKSGIAVETSIVEDDPEDIFMRLEAVQAALAWAGSMRFLACKLRLILAQILV